MGRVGSVAALRAAGGFDAHLVCGEDEEPCLGLAYRTGRRVHRIRRVKTCQDLDVMRLGDWWRRRVKSGRIHVGIGGIDQVHRDREPMGAWAHASTVRLPALFGSLVGKWWLPATAALAYAASWLRSAQGLRRGETGWADAPGPAGLTSPFKVLGLQGIPTFRLRRLRRYDLLSIGYR